MVLRLSGTKQFREHFDNPHGSKWLLHLVIPKFEAATEDHGIDGKFARRWGLGIKFRAAMRAGVACAMSDPHAFIRLLRGSCAGYSLTSSLFYALGSSKVCPETGVVFQNGGAGFRVQPGHPNSLGPRERPLHTIFPAMAMRGGQPELSFGVMGGPYQAAGVVHVLQSMIDFGMDVQEAAGCAAWLPSGGAVRGRTRHFR
jgi:gamma-glutamyltranspeptidase / glutathione hydrolase